MLFHAKPLQRSSIKSVKKKKRFRWWFLRSEEMGLNRSIIYPYADLLDIRVRVRVSNDTWWCCNNSSTLDPILYLIVYFKMLYYS